MTLPRSPRPNYTQTLPFLLPLLSRSLSIYTYIYISLSPVSLSSYMALIIIKQLP